MAVNQDEPLTARGNRDGLQHADLPDRGGQLADVAHSFATWGCWVSPKDPGHGTTSVNTAASRLTQRGLLARVAGMRSRRHSAWLEGCAPTRHRPGPPPAAPARPV